MAALHCEPLHADFGVRVTGIDLRQPLGADLAEKIWALIDKYSFVHFPDQPTDDDIQLAFTRSLGEPEPSHVALGEEGRIEYFGTIGNVQPDGSKLGNDHRKTKFLTGNNMWHTDASFKPVPAALSIMCAYETPSEGGLTEFVSTRAAYRRLPEAEQVLLDPLITIHDYTYSRSKVSPDAVSPALSKSLPPVRQKLVRRNARADAKNLFIGSHVREVEGMEAGESRALLDRLVDHAAKPENIYAHAWCPSDLVIWDNRCLLHRGSGYDADKHRRRMRQTRVTGAASSLEE